METQIGVLATLILGLTQFITRSYPELNKMNVTLIVTLIVGVLSVTVSESVEVITVLLALVIEVFGYNLITKSIIPSINSLRNR